ncbi:MAG: sigma-70 family RNA polymerase sigma factor [Propionibacteriaceae bacterium]|nr:sigma-70 family RNA polymerase sigma factor [Propionibacteriaceae bacterium]
MTITRIAPLDPEIGTLTRAEEVSLLARIDAGVAARAALAGEWAGLAGASRDELERVVADGAAAHEALVGANTGLVWFVVNPVAARSGLDPDELFQEGMVGLLEAVPRFDPARGKFATCALPRIRLHVRDAAVTNHGSLGLPARRARLWRQVRATQGRLVGVLGRTPEVAEVARELGESPVVVDRLLRYSPAIPFDPEDQRCHRPRTQGCGPTTDEDCQRVITLVRLLSGPDRTVIVSLYGLAGAAQTREELAAHTGWSVSTIRRRERRALDLMRSWAALLDADEVGDDGAGDALRGGLGTMVA